MSLIRKPIKIAKAAEMLGVSPLAIRQGTNGTQGLTVFKRKGSRLFYTWESEVIKLLEDVLIVRKGSN